VTSIAYYEMVLRGFERVSLQLGEKKRISFTVGPDDLKLLDRDMHWTVEPGPYDVLVGASSEDIRLRGTFEIVARPPPPELATVRRPIVAFPRVGPGFPRRRNALQIFEFFGEGAILRRAQR
jgi:hypothetical protein